MKNEKDQQLELFSQIREYNRKKTPIPHFLLGYMRAGEKIILLIVGLIITGIISFSLGVERGKRITQLKTDSRLDIALKIKKIQPAKSIPPVQEPQTQPLKSDELKELLPNYTIQVASFINKSNAQKEADKLKRKGLSSMILPKGKFSIVCVGTFLRREEAESLLSRLKKQYQDCHIRRL